MTGDRLAAPGLFGKLPALGDFVRRRLPASFVEPWDNWLQGGVAASRAELGEAWLPHYLTSPIWRFVVSAGVCGEWAAAGVLVPSVDAVNRHYPLTIAAVLRDGCVPFSVVTDAGAWFARCEDLALAFLRPEFDPAALETACDGVGVLPAEEGTEANVRRAAGDTASFAWDVDLTRTNTPGTRLLAVVAADLASAALGRYSLWWTGGSDDLAPSFRIWRGLPPAADFSALLCDRTTASLLARRADAAGDAGAEGTASLQQEACE